MSTVESTNRLDTLPTFDLAYGVDDSDDPGEVTVFEPTADDVSTSWLSMDATHVVPLDQIA